ncbi:MAG: type II toxin-antitoxin system PemK/MazF family toxin [Oscillospiraceae bacterium]
MRVMRGEMYYIHEDYSTVGSEMKAGRPAIIVSNDTNNEFSTTVEVIYLTTKPKKELPTHTSVRSCSLTSTALCEQITTIDKSRIGDFRGRITEDEMYELESAILVSLGMERYAFGDESDVPEIISNNDVTAVDNELIQENNALREQLKEAQMKNDMLQQMYDALLSKVMRV